MREREARPSVWAPPDAPSAGRSATDASAATERAGVSQPTGPSSGVAVARGDARSDARSGAAIARGASDGGSGPHAHLRDSLNRGDPLGALNPADPLGPLNPVGTLGVIGAGGVLDQAFDLLRFRFRRFVALTAVVAVPLQLLDLWVALDSGTSRSGADIASPSLRLFDSTGSTGNWSLLLLVLQSTAMFLLGMAAGHLVGGWVEGRDDPFGTVVGAVARRIWVAPIVVVVGLVAKSAAACFGGVGFFLVDALFLVAGPVAGAERLGPFATIRRSVRLARRGYGTALAVSLGGFAITIVLRLALVAGPAALIVMIGLPAGWAVLAQQATSLTLLITLPLTACIAARAHIELRCRVEGEDIVVRAKALGVIGGQAA